MLKQGSALLICQSPGSNREPPGTRDRGVAGQADAQERRVVLAMGSNHHGLSRTYLRYSHIRRQALNAAAAVLDLGFLKPQITSAEMLT